MLTLSFVFIMLKGGDALLPLEYKLRLNIIEQCKIHQITSTADSETSEPKFRASLIQSTFQATTTLR